jgi:hypothetical protein
MEEQGELAIGFDPDWYLAVLEEYRSLRTEAITARDAQLAILRLALPLLAALVGIGVSFSSKDSLIAGILLSFAVPIIVALTFELWLGQVQRSLRAGSVVAAIEKRLARAFKGNGRRPPVGWEQWLRRRDSRGWARTQSLSLQRRESFWGSTIIFIFFFLAAAGSFVLGYHYLSQSPHPHDTAERVAVGVFILISIYLIARAIFGTIGLGKREKVPTAEEVWPLSGDWLDKQASSET